jgi:SAM-dependent methyltransferase
MPIGCCSLVPAIATQFVLRRPRSVLDLGIGMGFYGAVVRQWLDGGVQPWRTRLVGVEGFDTYRSPCWNLYDDVVVSSIERFLEADSGTWDAILLLDVLEHFEHSQGAAMLQQLRLRLTPEGRLFVGTPAVWMDQGPAYGNEFERHRSLWTGDEMQTIGFELLDGGATDRYGNQMLLGVASK